MSAGFSVVIPARHGSTRLPGKALHDISGKPLIQHVYESAAASAAQQVIVATDDERIRAAVEAFGGRAVMTGVQHQSGTDRIAEAVGLLGLGDDAIIVNVQGDEYGLPPAIIEQLPAAMHERPAVPMATLCEPISTRRELENPNIVKVVFNSNNLALYFSRAPIPWCDTAAVTDTGAMPCRPYRHIGIYGYRAGFLKVFTGLPRCPLEQSERLEQLRALYHGYTVYVELARADCGVGVDTLEDLERARTIAEESRE